MTIQVNLWEMKIEGCYFDLLDTEVFIKFL